MKKKIWLINQYAVPPKFETRIQTLKRAQYLKELGHDVTIIGGSFIHNTTKNLITDNQKFVKAEYNGIKFIHISINNYIGNGILRIYSSFLFSFRLFFLSRKFNKPDIIILTSFVPFSNILYFIAKKYKAKFIVDIIDLWPESFVAMGVISKSNPLTKFTYWAEKWLYEHADEIVFSMEGGKNYIIEKGWNKDSGKKIDLNKVHYINNGVDLGDFNRNKNIYKIDDSDLENDSLFKVIYLGSIRLVNNIKLLIDAADFLKDQKNIKFLIYGDGDERTFLEIYCKTKKIDNVIFKQKSIELKYVPYVLSKSSLNILNYMPNSILKYGGSQSKSFQYMASGKPICSNIKMAYCPITKYNLGIAREFENSEDYAKTILSFVNMGKAAYSKICENNIKAVDNYDYKKLTAEFEKLIY